MVLHPCKPLPRAKRQRINPRNLRQKSMFVDGGKSESFPKKLKAKTRAASAEPALACGVGVRRSNAVPPIPRALNDEAGPQARKDARVHAPRRPGSSRCSLCAKLQAKPTETVRPGTPGRVRSDERNTIRWTRNVASAEEHRASLAAAACRTSTILGAQRPFSCTTAARAAAQAAVLGRTLGG